MIESRSRRPHNELKSAIRSYLATAPEKTASISDIRAATEPALHTPPQSSYRSALQDDRYFERVSRGTFKLREERES